ncbi:unnamed protein product [Darwinula stevensoni]|uniref:Uncharacterized protein n=1 Tax=Darwinula stevensoni TaxID=69355 RepID=A0A7R9FNR2_9CRUS|nr:unnamed protein product [Darwinula stevensoni]CAG0896681.1 unnamed protein product [Darwinula stevensoni]
MYHGEAELRGVNPRFQAPFLTSTDEVENCIIQHGAHQTARASVFGFFPVILALVCVSQLISRGEFEGLKDLLSPECISEVSKNLSNYSLQDRHMLAVAEDDIYFAFPYQIGMIIEDDPPPKLQRRWVEVTMCYHVFLGMGETIRRGEPPPTPGDLQRNREKLIICNYRFIRNYTKGVNDDWTINKLNHFRPSGFS